MIWRKLNNLKPLFSGNEEHCTSKEVKENVLASQGKSCRLYINKNHDGKSIYVS